MNLDYHPVPWARLVLPHHMPAPSPEFHWSICDLVFGDHQQVAIAAPRGHAKSSLVDLICLLFGAAHKAFRYCLLVSDSRAQAELFLAEIKRECEQNDRLRVLHPDLRPGSPWTANDLNFSNGVRIQAVGSGEKLRGRKHRGTRPDLVLVDDLENDELVDSYDRRLKMRRWFRATLLPALAPGGKIRVIGTVLHTDSLLNRLLKNPAWERRLWKAIQDDGTALWPEWRPASKLLAEKEEAKADGLLSVWYQEFQNQPMSDEERAFRPEYFQYWDSIPPDEFGRPAETKRSLYVDPAISKSDKADWTAYTVVYATHDGHWYVQDAFRARQNPAEILDTIRELHRKHKFDVIGIEAVQFQKSLSFWLEELNRDGVYYPVEEVVPDQDKRRRIMALQPFVRSGRIKFKKGSMERLEAELINIDSIDHDDLADSLAGHLFITVRPGKPKKPKPTFTDRADAKVHRYRQKLKRQARERAERNR